MGIRESFCLGGRIKRIENGKGIRERCKRF